MKYHTFPVAAYLIPQQIKSLKLPGGLVICPQGPSHEKKLTVQINFLGNNLDIYTKSQLRILLAYTQLPIQQSPHFLQTPESKVQFVCRQAPARRRKTSWNQIILNWQALEGSTKELKYSRSQTICCSLLIFSSLFNESQKSTHILLKHPLMQLHGLRWFKHKCVSKFHVDSHYSLL